MHPAFSDHRGELFSQPEVQLNQSNRDLPEFFEVVDALDVVNHLDLFELSG